MTRVGASTAPDVIRTSPYDSDKPQGFVMSVRRRVRVICHMTGHAVSREGWWLCRYCTARVPLALTRCPRCGTVRGWKPPRQSHGWAALGCLDLSRRCPSVLPSVRIHANKEKRSCD
jgi:hypothetical protein